MYGYIYETTNIINGKKYIGQHKSSEFDESYYGSGKALQLAIKKYGKEKFNVKIIKWCSSRDEMNEQEKYYIKLLKESEEDYYNIANGGEGGDILNTLTPEKFEIYSKKKSDNIKGRIAIHKDNIEKMIFKDDLYKFIKDGWILGRTDEFKEKVSKRTRQRMIELGIVNEDGLSKEIKNKISKATKGKHKSESMKKKLSESTKGVPRPWLRKPKSEETKRRMSESALKRKRDDKGHFIKGGDANVKYRKQYHS